MAPAALDLDEYRSRVEEYLRRPGPAADAEHDELFAAEAVAALETAAADGGPRARALARFAAEGHLRRTSATEMARLEELVRVPLADGLTLLDVDAALAAEPDPDKRRELQGERLRAIRGRLESAVSDVAGLRAAAAQALGAATPAELIARAAGIDVDAAVALGRRALDAGDAMAGPELDRAARDALGTPLSALSAADLPRLLRAPHLEDALPASGARAAVEATCDVLGVPAPPRGGLTGTGGMAGYAEALRLAGLALTRGGASSRLPVEARALADPALAQATALLLESLLGEPAWLVRVLGLGDPGRIVGAARALRTLGARSTAARAAALAGEPIEELMARATGVEWPRELSLADELSGLAPADAVRGRALGGALRRHLRELAGERWFADPRAAELLRELWAEGGDLTPEVIAGELGGSGLEARDVVDEVG